MSRGRRRPQGVHQKNLREKSTGQVRIIAGHWRGRRLKFPSTPGLRPTGDRLRETLFNWLQAVMDGSVCLDLFAGSGALGLEALSRGAAHVTLVESNSEVAAALQQQIRRLSEAELNEGAPGEVQVVHDQAINWLHHQQCSTPFDVVFLDPPFDMAGITELAKELEASNVLSRQCWIYLESAAVRRPAGLPASWQLYREKKAGDVSCQLFRRTCLPR